MFIPCDSLEISCSNLIITSHPIPRVISGVERDTKLIKLGLLYQIISLIFLLKNFRD